MSSRRLFVFFKAQIIWYDFFFGSDRSLSDLRTAIVNFWNWNWTPMTLFYCVHYSFVPCLPFELVHKVLDGRRRNPPWQIPHAAVDGARNGERRPRQTWEGFVVFPGRCCVVMVLSVYFWILYCFISYCLDYKKGGVIGKLLYPRLDDETYAYNSVWDPSCGSFGLAYVTSAITHT